jgi:hypothetical protein
VQTNSPPHIILPPNENPGASEVLRWVILLLVALGSALVAYWLIPWWR